MWRSQGTGATKAPRCGSPQGASALQIVLVQTKNVEESENKLTLISSTFYFVFLLYLAIKLKIQCKEQVLLIGAALWLSPRRFGAPNHTGTNEKRRGI
jgi:hypothetical protein